MAVILFYIGFWAIYWNRVYQQYDQLIGNTAVKVKGNGYINDDDSIQIWDAQDVVYPPKEADALFVTTNFQLTTNQSRGVCSGSDIDTESCSKSCIFGSSTLNGINTGECDNSTGFCKLYAWCGLEPLMNTTYPQNILQGIQNFTVFMRVSVKFPTFNVEVDNANGTTVSPGYNLFTIQEMLERAESFDEWENISQSGAAIAVVFQYNCNLDKKHSDCLPTIQFIRIDSNINDHTQHSYAQGYNFRYTYHYYLPDNDVFIENRDLYKVYGLRFIFLVSGKGGKFNIIPLIINIGSGLALLGVATFVADIVALYVLPKRKFYNQVKYEQVHLPKDDFSSDESTRESRSNSIDIEISKEEKPQKASDRSPLLDNHGKTALLDTIKF